MTKIPTGNATRTIARIATFLSLAMIFGGCDSSPPQEAEALAPASLATNDPFPTPQISPTGEVADNSRHFFNVIGHSKEQVESLLHRALELYEATPDAKKDGLEIAMVLHGPDAQFFAKKNYSENKNLVDLAEKLEAVGFIDLKVCARSARSEGIENDGFPTFIEVVPYGPEAIENLREAGFTEI